MVARAIEEEILQGLGLPYRVVNVAAGDLGAPAVKKYDCEGWFAAQGRYRELTSTSNTTDFQARRLDIRYRPHPAGGKPAHVHTLNGTATAVGRTLIALLENHKADNEARVAAAEDEERAGLRGNLDGEIVDRDYRFLDRKKSTSQASKSGADPEGEHLYGQE